MIAACPCNRYFRVLTEFTVFPKSPGTWLLGGREIQTQIVNFMQKACWDFDWGCVESVDQFGGGLSF